MHYRKENNLVVALVGIDLLDNNYLAGRKIANLDIASVYQVVDDDAENPDQQSINYHHHHHRLQKQRMDFDIPLVTKEQEGL